MMPEQKKQTQLLHSRAQTISIVFSERLIYQTGWFSKQHLADFEIIGICQLNFSYYIYIIYIYIYTL